MPGVSYVGLVKVIEGGALTTVQDLGRFGYQSYGVPQCGALDAYSFSLGNIALGNPGNTPGLECTVTGPALEMLDDQVLCITGADLGPALDGQPCPSWRTVFAPRGLVLSFSGLKSGCRAYINFRGGIVCPPVLGSASTFLRASLGGLEGRELRPGDTFTTGGSFTVYKEVIIPEELLPPIGGSREIRALPGPGEDLFSPRGLEAFWGARYRVSHLADRMGYRLEGPPVEHQNLSAYSRGIPLGAVQVDGEGSPIVLLRDRQTVGGYPVIATVISVDVDLFAQMLPGDEVRFRPVPLDEAVSLYRERSESLRLFKEKTLR